MKMILNFLLKIPLLLLSVEDIDVFYSAFLLKMPLFLRSITEDDLELITKDTIT